MSWYLIELPDGALTPYAAETDSGTVYGWGEMPKRKIDLEELQRIADELELSWTEDFGNEPLPHEEVDFFEQDCAKRIRKAVGE